MKFQFEIRSNKTVIAQKPLTNLYEMNSSVRITTLDKVGKVCILEMGQCLDL